MMGGGSEREGMRSELRSMRSISTDESAVLPGLTLSGDVGVSVVADAPAARRRLMQSMCPCHAA